MISRPYFRYSLRVFLLAITCVALLLAYYGPRIAEELNFNKMVAARSEATAELKRRGGQFRNRQIQIERGAASLVMRGVDLSKLAVDDEGFATLVTHIHATGSEWMSLEGLPLSDSSVRLLKGYPRLQSLNLSSTKISDASGPTLVTLKDLRELDLSSTGVSDAILVDLAKLSQLEHADLSDTLVTSAGLEHFCREHPQIHVTFAPSSN